MTKQELATKIWASTNELRGNIELATYKDYMLSLLFYKFLSDKETQYLYAQEWTAEDIKTINESDLATVTDCQKNIGYFIAYENLFSTWVAMEHDFNVKNVIDGLNAFDRLIGDTHKKVFSKIFETLQSNISNLGSTAAEQTKALKKLIETINDIPTDTSEGYDVLGFIYEFLIGKFAANAGKKAGEFYTPHEVSLLMSEIVCNHLKDRDTIKVLDPTSGSGSLLINIGKAFTKYSNGKNNVEYFAQEFIKSTYNLTRMNLLMKGILPNNIHVRNGDTLAKDWPYFDETDPENTYVPMHVDAVVSNPPYSQKWDPRNRESDPRFSNYGIAPKSKADLAFLLYDLYHIRPDGIATIVLPHGVLFRGGEEGKIRENLIENNKIDAIIGLPANAFYGTPIATLMLVLKQNRENTDVLFIDASKGFIKDGKKNRLQDKDIKKIADTYIGRIEEPHYSRLVPKSEILKNAYNLNIPRYVDSSDGSENWDLYSLMVGSIPNYEIDELEELWDAFPSLRGDLFEQVNSKYSVIKSDNIRETIFLNKDVVAFMERFQNVFGDFGDYLYKELISDPVSVPVRTEKDIITEEIFNRYDGMPLIDAYEAYQMLSNLYAQIALDLEIIGTEGLDSLRVVDPNMVSKKKDDKTIEVQEGWRGRILPFNLVQQAFFACEVEDIAKIEDGLSNISSEFESILTSLTEEELDKPFVKEEKDGFINKEIPNAVKEILEDVSSPEIDELKEYLELLSSGAKKKDKVAFIENSSLVNWSAVESSKDGTYSAKNAQKYMLSLQMLHRFDEDTFESKILRVNELILEEKNLKEQLKQKNVELEEKTIDFINNISNDDAMTILEMKWVNPLTNQIFSAPSAVIGGFAVNIESLATKYMVTANDIEDKIRKASKTLYSYLNELSGDEFEMIGIAGLKKLLGGE